MDNRGFNLTSHRIWLVLASLFITANLLTACAPSVPSLPLGESFTDPSGESPPVHLLIDITPSGFSNGIPVFRTFVVALDPQTGHRIWHYQLGSGASSEFVPGSALQPVVAGDLAIVEYASSHNDEAHGVLEALDLRSGQLRWRHEAGTQPGELVIAGSVIYFIPMTNPQLRVVTSPSHVVEALDRQSGRLLWSHPVDGQPESFGVSGDKVFDITSPWPCGGRVSCWHLYVLNASDGSTRWGYALDAVFTNLGIGGPLSIMFDSNNSGRIATDSGNQLVYVGAPLLTGCCTATQTLLALRASDGTLAWQRPLGFNPVVPSQRGDILCLTVNQPYPGYKIVGLDAKTGQTRWSTTISGLSSSCIAGGDAFYFTATNLTPTPNNEGYTASRSVVALATKDGHQLWRSHGMTPLGAGISWVTHGFVGQVLTVNTMDGTVKLLVVYHADSGALAWQHEFRPDPQDPSKDQVRVEGGQVYITTPTIQPSYSPQIGQSDTVTAFSLSTGAQLWTYETGHL